MRDSPLIFKVPVDIFHDQELSTVLGTSVKDILTKARASLKVKVCYNSSNYHYVILIKLQIAASVLQTGKRGNARAPQNISELTKSLCPPGMEITPLHWVRVAFLVSPDVHLTLCRSLTNHYFPA
jgi:hypothetical protein